MSFFNTEYKYTQETGYVRTVHPIPYDNCNDSFSGVIEEEPIERFGLNYHLCPANTDYYLVGEQNSRIFRQVEIFIAPCNENNNEGIV